MLFFSPHDFLPSLSSTCVLITTYISLPFFSPSLFPSFLFTATVTCPSVSSPFLFIWFPFPFTTTMSISSNPKFTSVIFAFCFFFFSVVIYVFSPFCFRLFCNIFITTIKYQIIANNLSVSRNNNI